MKQDINVKVGKSFMTRQRLLLLKMLTSLTRSIIFLGDENLATSIDDRKKVAEKKRVEPQYVRVYTPGCLHFGDLLLRKLTQSFW